MVRLNGFEGKSMEAYVHSFAGHVRKGVVQRDGHNTVIFGFHAASQKAGDALCKPD